jgi:hypothetical protein
VKEYISKANPDNKVSVFMLRIMGGGEHIMVRYLERTTTVLVVLVLVMLVISSVAIAGPAGKSKGKGSERRKVHLDADIMKLGDTENHPNYGKVDFNLKETTHGDYKIKFKLDLKHAADNTVYDIYLWANIPDVPLTIYGDLSNMNWLYFETIFTGYGYDLDGTVNGKIETSLATLEISGYHIRDTMYDIETDKHGKFKCKYKAVLTQEELIEAVIDFTWPYIRQHMIGLIPALAPYLPMDSDFSAIGITSVTLYGGTYSVSTGILIVGPQDTYYTEPLSYTYSTDDFSWTI